jgi:hypothetical protein
LAMVVIAESVWETWRDREANQRKPSIALLLTADVPPEAAQAALAEATGEVMQRRVAKAEAAEPGEDEFRTGDCSFVRVPQGVLLRIDEGPDDFEELLQGIAEGLRARGIEGRFDLYEPEGIPELPELVDLFECHLRPEGERGAYPNGKHFWEPDEGALAQAVAAGIAWCRDNRHGIPLALTVSLLPPVSLDAGEDIERYVVEGIESARPVGVVQLTSAAPDRFRTFSFRTSNGGVGMIEGGTAVRDDWQSSVKRVTEVLRESAPWAVYGFVKRGSRRTDAILGTSLPSDWLEVPHTNVLVQGRWAFEDRFVPDAFGVQLLSPGHGENVPEGRDWRVERLVSGRVLVEHVDPAAWFDGSLVRFGGHGNPFYDPFPPAPRFLTRAREDFDPILYRDGSQPAYADVLGDRRFTGR